MRKLLSKILLFTLIISIFGVNSVKADDTDFILEIPIEVEVNGGTIEINGEANLPEVTQIQNKGAFVLRFVNPKLTDEYLYTVYQVNLTDSTLVYDDTIYEVRIRFSDTGNDTMKAIVTVNEEASDKKSAEIVFTNEHKVGNVLVVYETEDGDTLKEIDYVCKNCIIGTDFSTTKLDFEGYEFIRVESCPTCEIRENDSVSGKVREEDIIVKYIYRKLPEPIKSSVLVVHKDIDTGEVLKEIEYVVKDVEVGTNYSTHKENFEDYEFVQLSEDSAPANGKVTENEQTVIYLYRKKTPEPEKKYGNVLVVYKDEKTGEILKDIEYVIKNGEVGTPYTTEELSFDNYVFSRMDNTSAPRNGNVKEGDQTVIYLYKHKVGNVLVVHKSETGEVLKEVEYVCKDCNIGTPYTTSKENFEDYEFVRVENNPTGEVIEGDIIVTYIYKKKPVEIKKGTLTVIYKTEDGIILKELNSEGKVGDPYNTEKLTFDGYTFSRMDSGSAAVSGEYIDGHLVVTYIYKKPAPVIPTPIKELISTGGGRVALGATATLFVAAIALFIVNRKKKEVK